MYCYFCGEPSTGAEHVPPKSFFIKGQREGLITVPSCDVHNQQKSKDDEYIRSLLLTSAKLDGNKKLDPLLDAHMSTLHHVGEQISGRIDNEGAFQKFFEIEEKLKGDPAIGMKAFSELQKAGIGTGLLGLLSVDYEDELIVDEEGNETPTISFVYDVARFNNFFKALSKAIFFHESKTVWFGEVVLISHSFLRDDLSAEGKRLAQMFRSEFERNDAKGAQKDIFYYDLSTQLDSGKAEVSRYILNFCLYDTYEFTALFERHNLVVPD